MKNLFLLFVVVFFISCDKNDDVTLDSHVVGKWGVYSETDENNTAPLGAFEFKSNGVLYVYSSIDFSINGKTEFKWSVNSDNQIVIVLQGNPIMQGDPIMFPNATQGDPIMIPVDVWKQGDPIMHVSIYGKSYRLVRID
jgi:hypothetical protein